MHRIPQFQFCYVLRWQIYIKIISIFKLLTYLVQLRIQLCLHDTSFPITYLSNCFCESNTTWVFNIEMVPIQNPSTQSLRYVYFAMIVDYLDIIKSLLGITRYLIRNICTEFGISMSQFCFVVLFLQLRDLAGNNLRCFLPYQQQITRLRDNAPSLYRACTC